MKARINILMIAFAMLFSGVTFAQNARETTVKLNKTQQNAMIADYQAAPKVTQEALKEYLNKAVVGKMKTSKGFYTFTKATWTEIGNETADIYFKVDGKKNKSTISVLYSKGYDNFISSSTDPEISARVAGFLNNFNQYLSGFQNEMDIEKQYKVVAIQNDELKKAIARSEEYKKEIKKLGSRLEDNDKEIEKIKKQIENDQNKLEQMK